MADWRERIELPLTDADRAWAREWADALGRSAAEGRHYDQRATRYWSSWEINCYGRLGEAGLARLLGITELLPVAAEHVHAERNDGGVDLPGYDVGVKCSPWRRPEHFHKVAGGRLVVPLRPWGFAATYALLSYFVATGRLYLDGYATGAMVGRAPRLRSNGGKPAVELRYEHLLPAQVLPVRLGVS